MSSLLDAPMGVAYHLVLTLAAAFAPLGLGLATAAAIVAFTMAVRLVLLPLSYSALRGQARLSGVLTAGQELQRRYAKQPDRLQRELTELYRRDGAGLLVGCLPLLVQLPFFSVMYRLFRSGSVAGQPNSLLSRSLFGTPLGSHWLTGAGPLSGHGLVFLGLFLLLALVATGFVLATSRNSMIGETKRQLSPKGLPDHGTSAVPGGAGQPAGALGLLSRILPYATLVIAALVPLAAGIYLLTTTAWTLAERTLLRRWSEQRKH